jgi:CBS domain-containing protein
MNRRNADSGIPLPVLSSIRPQGLVQQLMSTRIISCRSSDRVDAVLATMTTARIRHLPVIEDKELKGIVSIGDLVKHRLDEKELEASVLLDISRMRA